MTIRIITENHFVKHEFTEKELLELSMKMARAEQTIREKEDEMKSFTTTKKAEIAEQDGIIHTCAEQIRSGYRMVMKECSLRYIESNGTVEVVDIESGEVIETRPITKDEQLRLTGKVVDAEDIIRDDNERIINEDIEDDEG